MLSFKNIPECSEVYSETNKMLIIKFTIIRNYSEQLCSRNLDLIYISTYYIKWEKTSQTFSTHGDYLHPFQKHGIYKPYVVLGGEFRVGFKRFASFFGNFSRLKPFQDEFMCALVKIFRYLVKIKWPYIERKTSLCKTSFLKYLIKIVKNICI